MGNKCHFCPFKVVLHVNICTQITIITHSSAHVWGVIQDPCSIQNGALWKIWQRPQFFLYAAGTFDLAHPLKPIIVRWQEYPGEFGIVAMFIPVDRQNIAGIEQISWWFESDYCNSFLLLVIKIHLQT